MRNLGPEPTIELQAPHRSEAEGEGSQYFHSGEDYSWSIAQILDMGERHSQADLALVVLNWVRVAHLLAPDSVSPYFAANSSSY